MGEFQENIIAYIKELSSVQFSRSVVSDSLQPHGLQHTRPPCPSPTPGVCSNSCPSSWWCYPTISFSVIPFSSCISISQCQGLFQWVSSSHQVAMALVSWMLSYKPIFSLFSFVFIKRLFSSSLSAIKVVLSAYLRLLIFLPAIWIPACSFSHDVLCIEVK